MNIGDLYAETLAASSAAANLILVTPDKYTGFTPASQDRSSRGFIFQIVGDEAIGVQSDITDHYVEDNTAKQDHISQKPITVTVSGFIGELNNVIPEELEIAKLALDKLGTVEGYIPEITNTARRAFNTALQVYSLAQKIKTANKALIGIDVKTKQEKAFSDLYTFWKDRTLFYVSTPFGQFSNMAIQSIQATQGADSKYISDFTVVFKEMRFAKVALTYGNRTNDDYANKGNQGVLS